MPSSTIELQAKVKAEQDEFTERRWYAEQIDSLHEGVTVVKATHVKFVEAARSGDLPAAFTAWLDFEKVKAREAQWSFLVHRKLDVTRIKAELHELREKLAWAERKKAGLAGRVQRGEGERRAFAEWSQTVAKLGEQIEQLKKLEKLGGESLPPAPLQRGVGDFSKDLQTALNKVVTDDAGAYVRGRLADLNKALGK